MRIQALLFFTGLTLATYAIGDVITFGGQITQFPDEEGVLAVNNPSLNNLDGGEDYTVTINLAGTISGTGTFAGTSMVFSDPTAPTTESGFSTESVVVTKDGTAYDLSVLGCLMTGSACDVGNYLSANFSIPMSDLNSTNVTASPVAGLNPPLDLLEDDGVTDVQGTITSYSYAGSVGTTDAPEPSQVIPLVAGLAVLWIARRVLRRPRLTT